MQYSIDLFSGVSNSELQKVLEKEQETLICGLLIPILGTYFEHEFVALNSELSDYHRRGYWPKYAPIRLANTILLHHFIQLIKNLAKGTNFNEIGNVVNSYSHGLLQEIIEGLLSAFHNKLETYVLSGDEFRDAFEKYGTRSNNKRTTTLGLGDATRDLVSSIQSKLPVYDNCIRSPEILREAQNSVAEYQNAEKTMTLSNYEFSKGIMGYVKQMWEKGRWTINHHEKAFESLLAYQERNFSDFAKRPISQLALKIRDHISLQPTNTTLALKSTEKLFNEIWRLFRNSILEYLTSQQLFDDSGHLKTEITSEYIYQVIDNYRDQLPTILLERISKLFADVKDSLNMWTVVIPLLNVKVGQEEHPSNTENISFCSNSETDEWYRQTKNENWPDIQFDTAESIALIEDIEARDATTAGQKAYRKLQAMLDRFVFSYHHGEYYNPKFTDTNIFCIEQTVDSKLWSISINSFTEDSLFLRRSNDQMETFEHLMNYTSKLNAHHPLAKRIDRAIYWYQRASWSSRPENRLLYYWICLEALLGFEHDEKMVIKVIIPFRSGLLFPTLVLVDGDVSYGQLRNWTREFIEDVYQVRNEIIHGGIFDGPSIDRFIDRFRFILNNIIKTVMQPFVENFPIPSQIDEILAWVWTKYSDDEIAKCKNDGENG